jgi:hypothetical protein
MNYDLRHHGDPWTMTYVIMVSHELWLTLSWWSMNYDLCYHGDPWNMTYVIMVIHEIWLTSSWWSMNYDLRYHGDPFCLQQWQSHNIIRPQHFLQSYEKVINVIHSINQISLRQNLSYCAETKVQLNAEYKLKTGTDMGLKPTLLQVCIPQ